MISDHIAALLRPVPGATGSCAHSPEGVDDDIPVGHGRFENIVAIGKLLDRSGNLRGWVYKTAGNHVRIQRVAPPLGTAGLIGIEPHTYSEIEPFTSVPGAAVSPCTRTDYRYRAARTKR